MKKILLIKTFNNGYGCSCCAEVWENHEWVKQEDFTEKKILKIALDARKDMNDFHLIGMKLEDNGKLLYGFEAEICRVGERLYWLDSKKKTLLKDLKEK